MASQAAGSGGVPPPGLSGSRMDNVQAEPSQVKAPPSLNPLLTIEARWRRSMKALAQRPQPVPGTSDAGDTDNVPTTTLTLRDLQSTSHAWALATRHLALRHLDDTSPRLEIAKPTLLAVYATLKQAKLMHNLLIWFLRSMYEKRFIIVDDITPRLRHWEKARGGDHAYEIIIRLYRWRTEWYRETGAFTHHGIDSYWPFKRTFRTIVLSFLPSSFSDALASVLLETFYDAESRPHDVSPLSTVRTASETRQQLANALEHIGILLDFKTLINSSLDKEIEKRVLETCAGVRDIHCLPMLRAWFNEKVKGWMTDIFGKERPDAAYRKFEHHMLQVLCDLRISELFDIIVDYEDKTHPLPVLQDLKDCLARTGQRKELVKSLRQSTIRRLLQPGAATSDILQQYVSTIKVLRYLDPPGVLLYGVAEPIRRYLRDRPDCIKIIVANLIPRRHRKKKQKKGESTTVGSSDSSPIDVDLESEEDDDDDKESEGFLLDDQNEPTPIQANEEVYEDYTDTHWMPAANDAEPGFRVQKTSDIISTLVSIFGSKDLFVKELQVTFGQRLLAITDGNYDQELHNLEILKIRFGDSSLHVCDVMTKDLTDSRRVNQRIQKDTNEELVLQPTIVSHLYWPPMPKSNLQMPGQFEILQGNYEKAFRLQKPDKKLHWIPNMGIADLTIQMDDGRELNVSATPLQAAVVELFSQTPQWTVDALADKLGKLDVTSIALALMFWQGQGVIEDIGDRNFRLRDFADEALPLIPATGSAYHNVDTLESETSQRNFTVYFNFVEALLTNLGRLPSDRVHSMLRLVPGPPLTLEETLHLLDIMKQNGSIDFRDGLWRLKVN